MSGNPSLRPFLFLIISQTYAHLEAGSLGSPFTGYQWEKTHWGKAYPAVAPLKAAVKPKDSATGIWALTKFNGVPYIYSF